MVYVPQGQALPVDIDPQNPPPYVRELVQQLTSIQTGYFLGLFNEAEAFNRDRKHALITDEHRTAGIWLRPLGYHANWITMPQELGWKSCPNCGEHIPAAAIGCQKCGTNLPKFYLEFGIDPSEDSAVAAFIGRMAQEAGTVWRAR
jgi:hypothetical protein